MSTTLDFPVTTHGPGAGRTASTPPPPAPPPPVVLALLDDAEEGLDAAEHEPNPARRFAQAYLCALRAAAAVLAVRGRPHRGPARPASVWTLLAAVAPELREWAAFFAAESATRARAQAGITRVVTARTADDLVRQAGQFLDLAGRACRSRKRSPRSTPGRT